MPYTRHCILYYIIEMLKQMETAPWQCFQSHGCQCVTQHHSSWPSGLDRWQSSTMRSKRPLDSSLRRCGFVSSFVVSSVVLRMCSKLGAGRQWYCLLYWLIPQRPSGHRHWHRHRQRWHRQRPWRQFAVKQNAMRPWARARAMCITPVWLESKLACNIFWFWYTTAQLSSSEW